MNDVTIKSVPADKLEETVRRAREDGATKLVITRNHGGTFDVVVTLPD